MRDDDIWTVENGKVIILTSEFHKHRLTKKQLKDYEIRVIWEKEHFVIDKLKRPQAYKHLSWG